MLDTLCPFCGAYSTRQCELEEEIPGCSCPWEDQLADERERDPDRLREDRDERAALVSGSREDGASLLRTIETLPDDFTDDGNCCAGKLKEHRP